MYSFGSLVAMAKCQGRAGGNLEGRKDTGTKEVLRKCRTFLGGLSTIPVCCACHSPLLRLELRVPIIYLVRKYRFFIFLLFIHARVIPPARPPRHGNKREEQLEKGGIPFTPDSFPNIQTCPKEVRPRGIWMAGLL